MAALTNWEEAERIFWKILALCFVLGAAPGFYFYAVKGAGFYALGVLAFAAEFKLLIFAVQLMLGTRKGNFLVLFGVVTGKILAWLVLAGAPFWLPLGMGIPFGIGCGVFALSLVVLLVVTARRAQTENR